MAGLNRDTNPILELCKSIEDARRADRERKEAEAFELGKELALSPSAEEVARNSKLFVPCVIRVRIFNPHTKFFLSCDFGNNDVVTLTKDARPRDDQWFCVIHNSKYAAWNILSDYTQKYLRAPIPGESGPLLTQLDAGAGTELILEAGTGIHERHFRMHFRQYNEWVTVSARENIPKTTNTDSLDESQWFRFTYPELQLVQIVYETDLARIIHSTPQQLSSSMCQNNTSKEVIHTHNTKKDVKHSFTWKFDYNFHPGQFKMDEELSRTMTVPVVIGGKVQLQSEPIRGLALWVPNVRPKYWRDTHSFPVPAKKHYFFAAKVTKTVLDVPFVAKFLTKDATLLEAEGTFRSDATTDFRVQSQCIRE